MEFWGRFSGWTSKVGQERFLKKNLPFVLEECGKIVRFPSLCNSNSL